MLARTPPQLLSPEAALGWEFWTRYRRQLPWVLLAMSIFPLIEGVLRWGPQILSSITFPGRSQTAPEAPPVEFQSMALATQLLALPLLLLAAPPLRRVFLLPVASRRLFGERVWQLSAGAVIAMSLSIALANVLLRSDWPYVPPILLALVVIAGSQWIAVEFRGRQWGIALFGAGLAGFVLWSVSRNFYRAGEGWFKQPFERFGVADALILVAVYVVLVRRTLAAAELERCATRLTNVEGITRTVAGPVKSLAPHRALWTAMLAAEWKQNGTLFPVAIAVSAFLGFSMHLFSVIRDSFRLPFGRGPQYVPDLASGQFIFAIGVLILAMGPFCLLFTTASGRRLLSGARPDSWLLTLPVSNSQIAAIGLARSLLSLAAGTLLWCLIGFAFLVVGQLYFRGQLGVSGLFTDLRRDLMQERHFLYGVVVYLATTWTLCGIAEAALQSGRRAVAVLPQVGLLLWVLSLGLLNVFRMRSDNETAICLVIAALSFAAYVIAVRRGEIAWTGTLLCALLWSGTLTLLAVLGAQRDIRVDELIEQTIRLRALSAQEFLISSCVTLPITLTPVAVGWNRSR